MNVINLLKEDHREAIELIERLEDVKESNTVSEGEDLFRQLRGALEMHSSAEEEIFYPALKAFDETRDVVKEAYQEHNKIDQLLAEMALLSLADEEFQDKLAELKEVIEDHVSEEEEELFSRAEELFEESKLQEMGNQMQRIKKDPSLVATRGL